MASTLRSLVVLAPPACPADGALSAASRLAYGCVAVSDPGKAPALAMMLIHEVRHMTLGGALDLVDLYEPGGVPRHYAPWRLDPRPVGALLQGAYAHIGVTDFWQAERRRAPAGPRERERADRHFAYWREVTTRAVATLSTCGELTALGTRFVDGLAAASRQWWGEAVPDDVAAVAQDRADADAVLWRVMNQRPEPGSVTRLQGALGAQASAEPIGPPLIRARAATPAHRRSGPASHRSSSPWTADAQVYRDRIIVDPDDDEAWAGLTLALRRRGTEPAATVLTLRPDLVRALYKRSRTGPEPDRRALRPDDVAAWLAGGLDETRDGQ